MPGWRSRIFSPIVWLLPFALQSVLAQQQQHPEMEHEDWDRHFLHPRQLGTRAPEAARLAAHRKLSRKSARTAEGPVQVSGTWHEVGPRPITRKSPLGPVAGRVTALALDPRDANRMYLGTANGGVFASANGGVAWNAIDQELPFPNVGAIAIDPRNPDVLYVGMGDPDGRLGIGIYRSADRGATWEAFPSPVEEQPASFRCLAVHPRTGDLYACLNRVGLNNSDPRGAGLYRYSAASGEWRRLLGQGGVDRLAIHPTNPQVMYTTLYSYNGRSGVYKTIDGGSTWTQSNGSGAASLAQTNQASRFEIALAPSAPDTLYAAVAQGQEATVYKSTDGAVSWQKLAAPANYCGGQCSYNNSIAVHPTRPDVLYLGGVWLYRSTDGGRTFTNILEIGLGEYSGAYVDYHFLVFSPDARRLLVGNDGGIFQFNDPAGTIRLAQSLNSGLGLVLVRGKVATANNDLNFAIAGTQDLLTQRYMGALTWDSSAITYRGTGCGDGGHAAIDPSNANNIYVTCFTRDLMRSTDKGLSFVSGRANIAASDRVYGNPPILFDPSNPRRI
jgi:photosystem II stability/assembly factor-like uncharacterized protein